jgi:lysophospholipase L1-like esterase
MLASIVLTLLLLEGAFRISAYRNDLKTLEHLRRDQPVPKKDESVSLGNIIRLSTNPRIIYDLIPNAEVNFIGQIVTINSTGFRSPEVPLDKPVRTIRIVGLGDSVMFGWGVRNDEHYLSLLERLLNEKLSSASWQIINTAVPGYNTVMEVETLKEKGLALHPDIVIINFVGNDTGLPNFISEKQNYFSLKDSFLFNFIFAKAKNLKMVSAPRASGEERFEYAPERVPPQYKSMVGEAAVDRALRELQSLSQANHFLVILMSHRQLPEWAENIGKNLHFDVVNTEPVWQRFIAAQNLQNPDAVWNLREKDSHPSVTGHKIIADALFEHFAGSDSIRKLINDYQAEALNAD